MEIAKDTQLGDQIPGSNTRHIKNIAFDFDALITQERLLDRFSVFIWQKQTSKLMFGSYPFPGNILENNTIEFINVYVKPGKPPKFDPEVKEANIDQAAPFDPLLIVGRAIIELKKGRSADKVFGQLSRYMGWVRKNLAKGSDVAGIIVGSTIDEKLRAARDAHPASNVDLVEYESRVSVRKV